MHIYEIKPMNRVLEGAAVVKLYIGILKTADVVVSLGPSDAPGTKGFTSAPGGVFENLPDDILRKPPQPGALAAFLRSHGIDVDEPPGPQSS